MESAPEDISSVEVYNSIQRVSSFKPSIMSVLINNQIFLIASLRQRNPRLPLVVSLRR